MSWFERLRDRHIFRPAFIYLGGAWASMEAIGFFVDNYGWSRKVLDVAVLLIVLGFPAALIIAWYHGEKGKQQVQRTEASLLLTLAVLAVNAAQIPSMLALILASAFDQTEAVGAFVGGSIGVAFSQGMRRALFSNEAGQGSAPIAHAAARTSEAAREGIVGGREHRERAVAAQGLCEVGCGERGRSERLAPAPGDRLRPNPDSASP